MTNNIERAASTIAANTILRSAIGCAFPLFSRQMMENLGTQWAGTMLGCIAVVMIPIPVLFKAYGPWLRGKSKLACSPFYDVEKKAFDV
jgi:DHA1 family multidrug resistance protein-like MFS transporter